MLGTWPSYIHTLIRMGKLQASKTNGKWTLDLAEVRAYAEQLKVKRQSRSDVMAGDGDAA